MNRLARYWRAQPLYSTLLITALLMRGLIPAGYMPAGGHGFFALELCAAVQTQLPAEQQHHHEHGSAPDANAHHHGQGTHADGASAAAPGANAHHHNHGAHADEASDDDAANALSHNHHHGGSTPAEHGSVCPFAASALSAPVPAVAIYTPSIEALQTPAFHEPQVLTSYLVVRSQSARAPPALS